MNTWNTRALHLQQPTFKTVFQGRRSCQRLPFLETLLWTSMVLYPFALMHASLESVHSPADMIAPETACRLV
jgi:hypothetical protein